MHSSEYWQQLNEFPGYSVSDLGRVRNDDTGRMMSQNVNGHGVVHVGLTKKLKQYRRSVAVLVARAFVEIPHQREPFDTPINLNGDRTDNRACNLMWRPLWFARKYFLQFVNPTRGFKIPIEDIKTGERFENSWDAATRYGLLDQEIVTATLNRTYVWPTYQMFKTLNEK
jgi:hypothetical protein